jgi:hypothetical protein
MTIVISELFVKPLDCFCNRCFAAKTEQPDDKTSQDLHNVFQYQVGDFFVLLQASPRYLQIVICVGASKA